MSHLENELELKCLEALYELQINPVKQQATQHNPKKAKSICHNCKKPVPKSVQSTQTTAKPSPKQQKQCQQKPQEH